MPSKARTQIQP